MEAKDIAKKVFAMSRKELFLCDIDIIDEPNDCRVIFDIHWGDWKHEHARLRWLMQEEFGEKLKDYSQAVTEEDGSDSYSAIHTFIISKK